MELLLVLLHWEKVKKHEHEVAPIEQCA